MLGNRGVVLAGDVVLPEQTAGRDVIGAQQPGRAEREQPVAVDRRCRARAGAGHRVGEERALAVRPQLVAGGEVVGRHRFHLAALLHGEGAAAGDGEAGPAGADRSLPEQARWSRGPVARKAQAADGRVAVGAEKTWEGRSGGGGAGARDVVGLRARAGAGRRLRLPLESQLHHRQPVSGDSLDPERGGEDRRGGCHQEERREACPSTPAARHRPPDQEREAAEEDRGVGEDHLHLADLAREQPEPEEKRRRAGQQHQREAARGSRWTSGQGIVGFRARSTRAAAAAVR